MPSTSFQRDEHGFGFVNRFPGLPLPTNTVEILVKEETLEGARTIHGLCGGMCFASLDYYFAGFPSPDFTEAPKPSTMMYNYLYKRQQASLGFAYRHVLRYLHNMIITKRGAQNLSYDQWQKLKRNLEQDKPSVLGLIFSQARQSMLLWHNHQVLAHAYEQANDGSYEITVYDPNYLSGQRPVIRLTEIDLSTGVPGVTSQLEADGREPKAIHSFFIVPYSIKQPPKMLKASQ